MIFCNKVEDESININFNHEMIVEDDCNNSKEGSIENTGDFCRLIYYEIVVQTSPL